jgi:hypothetical protein
MKKFFPVFLFLFVCAGVVAAQSQDVNVWKGFSGKNEEFVVEFPELYLEYSPRSNDKDTPRLYKAVFNGTYFFISSNKNVKFSHYDKISAFIEKNNAKSSVIKD